MEECRGAERKRGRPSCQYWWEQELELLEDEDEDMSCGGWGGDFPCRIHNEAGNEVGADQAGAPDPCEFHTDHPDAAPNDFSRGHERDG